MLNVVRYGSLLLVLELLLWQNAYGDRRLFIRDIVEPGERCRNTVQGRVLVTDDRGLLCKRDQLDYKTGCCSSGQQFDCNMCTMQDRCCTEFEACVSCCLKPEHDAVSLAKTVFKSIRHKESGYWSDPFEYCKGVCRTHSRSTMHENAYVSNRHHCFSKLRLPMVSDPLPYGALDGVEVVLGPTNESCDTVCSKKGKQCSAKHLAYLNSCDRLREHVGCEAGCEATATASAAVPAYVASSAPKANRPAMCFYHEAPSALTCGSKEQHYQRLCPCGAKARHHQRREM